MTIATAIPRTLSTADRQKAKKARNDARIAFKKLAAAKQLAAKEAKAEMRRLKRNPPVLTEEEANAIASAVLQKRADIQAANEARIEKRNANRSKQIVNQMANWMANNMKKPRKPSNTPVKTGSAKHKPRTMKVDYAQAA
jgi:hypothetical protein